MSPQKAFFPYLPLPDRVKAIQNYPKPSTAKQLHAYLGLLNYYHRFVKNLIRHLAPLYNLLKSPKKTKRDLINWTHARETVFENSKKLLADSTILNYPNPNPPTSIMVDASDTANGGVLQQKHNEIWKLIAFFFSKTRQNSTAVFYF